MNSLDLKPITEGLFKKRKTFQDFLNYTYKQGMQLASTATFFQYLMQIKEGLSHNDLCAKKMLASLKKTMFYHTVLFNTQVQYNTSISVDKGKIKHDTGSEKEMVIDTPIPKNYLNLTGNDNITKKLLNNIFLPEEEDSLDENIKKITEVFSELLNVKPQNIQLGIAKTNLGLHTTTPYANIVLDVGKILLTRDDGNEMIIKTDMYWGISKEYLDLSAFIYRPKQTLDNKL